MNWAEFKFPPINLWSLPYQNQVFTHKLREAKLTFMSIDINLINNLVSGR